MRALKQLLPLILIMLALLLSAVENAISLEQSRDQSDKAKAYQRARPTQEQQSISPAFAAAILETLRAEVSEEVAKREQDHADHKDWDTKPFWITFGLNAALVIVGTAYTIAAYRQLGAIKRQADLADATLIETQKASETAQRQAKAAEEQVVNLKASLVATEATARAAEKSADVGERALFAIERPHLVVENFKMVGYKARIESEEQSLAALPEIQRLTMSSTLRVTYTLKNYGKSPAFLTLAIIRFTISDKIPIPYGYGPYPVPRPGWILPPAEPRLGERFLESGQLTEPQRISIVQERSHLVLFGLIEYFDIFRNTHSFGFACRYVVGGGSDPGDRFEPVGDERFWKYT